MTGYLPPLLIPALISSSGCATKDDTPTDPSGSTVPTEDHTTNDPAHTSPDPDTTPSKNASTLELKPTWTTLIVGDTHALSASLDGAAVAASEIAWSSSDTAVLGVDDDGQLTALARGSVYIDARDPAGTGEDRLAFIVLDRADFEGEDPWAWMHDQDPYLPVFDGDAGGWTPHPDDPREQRVIDQGFSVPAGEEVVWDDLVIWVRPTERGPIEIEGTLVIRDSLLLWDQTEHQQTRLIVQDGGTLDITRSYAFWGNEYWVNWDFMGGSTIRFDRFIGNPWTSIGESVDYQSRNFSTAELTIISSSTSTRVDIDDAHRVYLEIYPPEHTTIDISFPPAHSWTESWDLSSLWLSSSVTVDNAYLYARDIGLDNGVKATIRDTEGFSVGWHISSWTGEFVPALIEGLGDPATDHGVYYADQTWAVSANDSQLRIINSTFERVWPTVDGYVNLVVRDTNLVDPRIWEGPATFEIHDSTIDHFAAYLGGRAYLENCQIRYDIEVKDKGTAVYGYNLSGRDLGDFEVIEIDGGVFEDLGSGDSPPGAPWKP